MVAMIGPRCPGWSWRRGACVWEGLEGRSYIWVRSGWRIGMVWTAAASVFGLMAWGLIV